MQRFKYVIILSVCITLILSISLSSCKNEKDSESSSYKEELIMLPDKIESIMDFRIENDGIIRIAGASNQTREGGIWESKDGGKTWNELYSYTDILKIDQKKRIECFPHLSNCDEVLCMVFHFKNDGSLDSSTRSYLLNATGECTEVMNKFPKSSVPDSSRIGDDISFIGCILDGNNLLLSNESGELYVVDKKSSEVIHRVCKKGNALLSPDSYMIDGNNLYCISQINTFKYDLEKNEIVEEEEKSLEKLANAYVKSDRPAVIDAENESYYIAENDGIKKYADGKSKPMVQAKDMSIIPSDVYLNKLFVTEDEKFYLSCNSENDPPMLLLYTPRKENSDKSQKELNVYTLQEDDNVKKMIDYYQKSNKEIEINLTVGMNDNKTEDDAIKKLNTQILAGDGPDVLFMDGMDIDKYIKGNMLMKVDQVDDKRYYSSILQTYSRDGDLYAVPLRFLLPVSMSKYENVTAAESTEALVTSILNNRAKIKQYSLRDFTRYIYQIYMCEIIKENGEIDKKLLKDYLIEIKRLNDTYSDGEKVHLSDLTLPPKDTAGMINVLIGDSDTDIDYVYSVRDLQQLNCTGDIKYEFAGNQKGKIYVPRMIMGISSAAKNEKESKDFMEFMLSDKGQKITGENMGLSIDKAVLEEDLRTAKGETTIIGNGSKDIDLTLKEMTDGEVNSILAQISEVETAADTNNIVMKIIMEATEKYLNGDIELNKAVSDIKSKLELYVSE